jgi:hypothetical protein
VWGVWCVCVWGGGAFFKNDFCAGSLSCASSGPGALHEHLCRMITLAQPHHVFSASSLFTASVAVLLPLSKAMPGPLFNFSAYLGSIIAVNAGYPFIVGTIVAWFGLFGPGVILMFAVRARS